MKQLSNDLLSYLKEKAQVLRDNAFLAVYSEGDDAAVKYRLKRINEEFDVIAEILGYRLEPMDEPAPEAGDVPPITSKPGFDGRKK